MSQRNQPHQQNGKATELEIQRILIEKGLIVSEPVRDCAYDLVVEVEGELIKTQIKRGYPSQSREGVLRVNLYRKSLINGINKRPYKESEIDAFIIHNPSLEGEESIYWIWFEEAPDYEMKRTFDSLQEHQLTEEI